MTDLEQNLAAIEAARLELEAARARNRNAIAAVDAAEYAWRDRKREQRDAEASIRRARAVLTDLETVRAALHSPELPPVEGFTRWADLTCPHPPTRQRQDGGGFICLDCGAVRIAVIV